MPDGAVLSELQEMVQDSSAATTNTLKYQTAFDNKQSTMPDEVTEDMQHRFRSVRPQLVVDEASVNNMLPQDLQTEHALHQIAGTTIEMSNTFEDQYVPNYLSNIFHGL